jgi:hypothetical protein
MQGSSQTSLAPLLSDKPLKALILLGRKRGSGLELVDIVADLQVVLLTTNYEPHIFTAKAAARINRRAFVYEGITEKPDDLVANRQGFEIGAIGHAALQRKPAEANLAGYGDGYREGRPVALMRLSCRSILQAAHFPISDPPDAHR